MTFNRKRKLKQLNGDEEMEFEKRPRTLKRATERQRKVRVRNLLPIKASSGKIISQSYEEDVEEVAGDEEVSPMEHGDMMSKPTAAITMKEEYIKSSTALIKRRRLLIEKKKAYISHVASLVLTDPQANYHLLKQLRLILEERDNPECLVTIRKLVMASLGCLFADIIPGYRIRERTEKEKAVKLSKEVRARTDFEENLLSQYQLYLKALEKMVKQRMHPGKSILISREGIMGIGEIAVRTLADLYVGTSHFNFHNNITVVFVPIANDDKNEEVRKRCCDSISSLFSTDKNGTASLNTVKVIACIAKERGPQRLKPEFLNTLLKLRIKVVDYSMTTGLNKQEKKKMKKEKKMLSRRERKHLKKQKNLMNEMKELAATEDQNERTRIHTEIVQQIFLIYFRILKSKDINAKGRQLIFPVVLEGLAKYAHLINIDFFGDLLKVLQQLIASNTMSMRENLHCVLTVFKILSGQGEVINVDPVDFYKFTYNLIVKLSLVDNQSSQNVGTTLECVELMLNKRRKQVTLTSLCAFIKRLSAVAMQLNGMKDVVAVLNKIEDLLGSNSKTGGLFDVDSMSLGSYDPFIEDPLHSKANCTVLWDLHLMRRHYAPLVSKSADRLLKRASK